MPEPARSVLNLRALSRGCGIVAALAGATALAGWTLDMPALKSIVPGLATMKANTGLCFIVSGVALFLLNWRTDRAWTRALGTTCGWIAVAIGAITLAEDLLGWNARIDQLLAHDTDLSEPGERGRMAPTTAVNFIFTGTALALLRGEEPSEAGAAQSLAAAILSISTLLLLGHLYGATGRPLAFYSSAPFTSATFLALGAGLLFAHPALGWMRELTRETTSARTGRRTVAAVLVILPLLGWLRLKGERAGWYGEEIGVSITAVGGMAVLVLLVLWITRAGNRVEDTSRRYAERLAILHEIDRGLIEHRTPETIAEAALRPLRDLLGVPRAIVNLFNFDTGQVEWLVAIGRHRMHSGPGVSYPLSLMGDIEALRRGEPQVIDTLSLPPSPHKEALLASKVEMYMAVPMIAGGELIGALSFGGEAREFPQEQMAVAQEAAAQLAIAVAQARLHERVQRQAEELEQRVQERTSELELANKELESFSYTVSHGLRTPLRAVDGFARIFEEDYGDKVDSEGRRLLGVIRDSSRRMGMLIDDLLAFSMLGRQALHPVEVDMGALAGEVWAELGDASPATFLLAPLPRARGDRALLRQVWSNLLSNALKYSAKRPAPVITVTCERRELELVYCVADNGAGFDPRYYAKLFGVFQRLHAESEFAGTGVGLATVQRVVARHGGRVWAESEVGAGAKFYFSLPLD
jgi:signal transduction histidine kinase